jgi:hypothetical protein
MTELFTQNAAGKILFIYYSDRIGILSYDIFLCPFNEKFYHQNSVRVLIFFIIIIIIIIIILIISSSSKRLLM